MLTLEFELSYSQTHTIGVAQQGMLWTTLQEHWNYKPSKIIMKIITHKM